jgi:hypothetical protein
MSVKLNIRWNTQIRVITVITAILLTVVEIILIGKYAISIYFSLSAVILAVVVGACILNAPLSITLNGSQLVLKRVFGKIVIKYSQINSVRPYIQESSDIRVFGSGGFCGYTGIFSNREIGKYISYVGDPKQSFLISTKNGKNYVFSCENVEIVIETIKKYLS